MKNQCFTKTDNNLIKNLENILKSKKCKLSDSWKNKKKCTLMYLSNTSKFNFLSKVPPIITDIIKDIIRIS